MARPKKKTRPNPQKTSSALRSRRKRTDAYNTSFDRLEGRKLLAAITVGTSADLVDGDTSSISSLIAAPGSDGAISLREAIAAADNTSGLDTITFDPAVFNGEQDDVIYLQSTLTISESVTIDAGDLGVVISGDRDRNDTLIEGTFITGNNSNFGDNIRVFESSAPDQSVVTLSGLTITGGNTFNRGGGVLSHDGSLVIEDSIVSGNRGGATGGIHALYGSVTIIGSSITRNTADDLFGGGGVGTYQADVTIVNSSVSDNLSIFDGAGVDSTDGDITVINSTISENVSGHAGGGIDSFRGDIVITGSTISGNTSIFSGSAVNTFAGALTIANSTISGNVSRSGSGIHAYSGAVTITDSTITRNETESDYGAGVRVVGGSFDGADPSLTVRNSIIAGKSHRV